MNLINKEQIIIIDIDGTIAFRQERHPHDFEKVDQDLPNEKLIKVLKVIFEKLTHLRPIFVSGRMESCRMKTLDWLKIYCCDLFEDEPELYMRVDNDFRDDNIIKQEIYHKMIEPKYDVFLIFDDRDRVVEMWRSLGLTCYQVASGNF
jgi:hypothetical protein